MLCKIIGEMNSVFWAALFLAERSFLIPTAIFLVWVFTEEVDLLIQVQIPGINKWQIIYTRGPWIAHLNPGTWKDDLLAWLPPEKKIHHFRIFNSVDAWADWTDLLTSKGLSFLIRRGRFIWFFFWKWSKNFRRQEKKKMILQTYEAIFSPLDKLLGQ